jgi:hypothetical protein
VRVAGGRRWGLTKNDDVRSSPGGGGENDLDLLSSRETPHGVVGNELGLQ